MEVGTVIGRLAGGRGVGFGLRNRGNEIPVKGEDGEKLVSTLSPTTS